MSETSLAVFFLGLISFCALAVTILLFLTLRDLRGMIRQASTLLLGCKDAVQEARHTIQIVRQMLARTDQATHQVEAVVRKTCRVASDIVDQVALFKGRAQTFLASRFGNGARSVSRRHYR